MAFPSPYLPNAGDFQQKIKIKSKMIKLAFTYIGRRLILTLLIYCFLCQIAALFPARCRKYYHHLLLPIHLFNAPGAPSSGWLFSVQIHLCVYTSCKCWSSWYLLLLQYFECNILSYNH